MARLYEKVPSGVRNRVTQGVETVRWVASELQDHASGGPEKRSAAAKKGARTRKLQATQRSQSAKKGAKTRSKSK